MTGMPLTLVECLRACWTLDVIFLTGGPDAAQKYYDALATHERNYIDAINARCNPTWTPTK